MSTHVGIISNKIYTIPQAAEAMEVDPRTLRGLIKRGDVNAVPVGNSYRVLGEHLLRFAGSVNIDNVYKQSTSQGGPGVPPQNDTDN